MQLIPAIDLRHGQVVRLEHGDDRHTTLYGLDPSWVLSEYAAEGVELVHVIDLDAAFGERQQLALIEELVSRGQPRIELGGGLKDQPAVERALAAGCERVVLGSMVARDFDLFRQLATAHPGQLVPAVETAAGEPRVAGWREAAGVSLEELCQRLQGLPCPAVLVTDIDCDGMLEGPNLPLTTRVAELTGLPALVSGGIASLDDLRAAATTAGVTGAIVGKALYEGLFSLAEAMAAATAAEDA